MAPAEVSQNRYVKFSTWSQMVEIIYFLNPAVIQGGSGTKCHTPSRLVPGRYVSTVSKKQLVLFVQKQLVPGINY